MANAIDVRLDGIKELAESFKKLDKDGRKRVSRAINENAVDFRRSVAKTIRKNTGRYIKYKRKSHVHWSSSPKRAPNSDTGNLVKNLRITQRASGSQLGAVVISGAKYSQALEFGHKIKPRRGALVTVRRQPTVQGPRRGRVEPRPFMFPMLKRKTRQYIANIKQAMNGAIVSRGGVANSKLNSKITRKA